MIKSLFSKDVLDFMPELSLENETFNKVEIRKILESVIDNFKYEGNDKDLI